MTLKELQKTIDTCLKKHPKLTNAPVLILWGSCVQLENLQTVIGTTPKGRPHSFIVQCRDDMSSPFEALMKQLDKKMDKKEK